MSCALFVMGSLREPWKTVLDASAALSASLSDVRLAAMLGGVSPRLTAVQLCAALRISAPFALLRRRRTRGVAG